MSSAGGKSGVFLYLGWTSNVHFFLHVNEDGLPKETVDVTCGQVHNAMIHETMLKLDESVVVYTVATNTPMRAVVTTQISFKKPVFPKDALRTTLNRLLSVDRSKDKKLLLFKAQFGIDEKKDDEIKKMCPTLVTCHEIEGDDNIKPLLQKISDIAPLVSQSTQPLNITYTLSSKAVPYLEPDHS
jgi:hypothetical protein